MDVDRGWAWVVLGAAFIINALSGGIIYSFGILYIDFLDRAERFSAETVAVGALSFACFGFVGPFARALTKKIGYRLVAMVGSNIAFIGLLISAFVPTIHYHYVTFGGILGAGAGFIYVASRAAVHDYFDKRLLLATSVASCGTPAGLIIFAILTRVFLDTFSHYGTFIVLSAIMLNGVVCSLLFKPSDKNAAVFDTQSSTYERMGSPVDENPDNYSESSANTSHAGDEHARLNDKPNRTPRYRAAVGPAETIVVTLTPNTNVVGFSETSIEDELVEEDDDDVEDNAKPDIEGPAVPTVDETKNETARPHEDQQKNGDLITNILVVMFGIHDPAMLCDWRLMVLVMATLLFSMGFGIPIFFYPDVSRDYGSGYMTASGLLSLVGVSMVTGVLLLSFISHKLSARFRWSTVLVLCLSLITCGLVTMFVHYYTELPALMVSAVVFGLFSASFNALRDKLLVEIFGKANIHKALGILYIVAGVGYIIGLPIAGCLRDRYTTYTWSFVLSATCMVASGLVTLPLLVTRTGRYELQD